MFFKKMSIRLHELVVAVGFIQAHCIPPELCAIVHCAQDLLLLCTEAIFPCLPLYKFFLLYQRGLKYICYEI